MTIFLLKLSVIPQFLRPNQTNLRFFAEFVYNFKNGSSGECIEPQTFLVTQSVVRIYTNWNKSLSRRVYLVIHKGRPLKKVGEWFTKKWPSKLLCNGNVVDYGRWVCRKTQIMIGSPLWTPITLTRNQILWNHIALAEFNYRVHTMTFSVSAYPFLKKRILP